MKDTSLTSFLQAVIKNLPMDWINLTTHRLDIYNESRAKTEFLEKLEELYEKGESSVKALEALPTAYDYIRLGHPLSSVLEWALAKDLGLKSEEVITFSSRTMPLLAVLRANHFSRTQTRVLYTGDFADLLDVRALQEVYDYEFVMEKYTVGDAIAPFDGTTVLVQFSEHPERAELDSAIDIHIQLLPNLGSIVLIDTENASEFVKSIQHVRRRESIAMTPANCLVTIKGLLGQAVSGSAVNPEVLERLRSTIADITGSKTPAAVASSGLSIQYAIMMGLIDSARVNHPGKEIKIIVPPNCYGGTNDQARRVAAALDSVEVMDLPVDGANDMVRSTEKVLDTCAQLDAVPLIIAEIPTNPRVEVPNLDDLRAVLSASRNTPNGDTAVRPVFILDQTFCPNVQFVKEDGILSEVQTISYVSGSKFPSGGKCTAGYCVANDEAAHLMEAIAKHLEICDNQATALQVEILNEQMPSMLQRIADAYVNTREFVRFIEEVLPEAKINFVSEEVVAQGFTPSVFSLDLPTKGETPEAREEYKRMLNLKLIHMMIDAIPQDSKYCVSYGQLKGCYWTIPATSTQGTTKEEDKDYIARVSVSGDLDLEKHKEVFRKFVEGV
ncbi:PLP-dependent aminotransferase family protein [Phaeocystidibacter marisrubri]|uniref:Cystathionine beta-synthase n=1 Tax=Phaeocystidibacter marisrubri TaxID=1577780 RepID=A0A6L3ZG23_9FLAO|nr:PLP-dependent transferase [Phaeocystidibacter marisrubri]KAB2816636.1 cystathionine beta-synthase [Phaeocystidibacter marisrubri]